MDKREIRLREALRNALGAWVADTAGETSSPAVYAEAEAAIAESEAATSPHPLEITHAILQAIMPHLSPNKRSLYLPNLNAAMQKFEINTPLRVAAFLAQIAHESGELFYMEEIWVPTKAQKGYEGRADLGNTEEGDGYRFRGRGPIQLTGRANYKKYGDLLGVNLVADPDLAQTSTWAFQTAGLYWNSHGLNELADQNTDESFRLITKRINGGFNGLADRQKYYEAALLALGVK